MIRKLFFHNWPHKLFALFAAAITWVFINHTILETKRIPRVPVRVINLPAGKTAMGMLTNGTLAKRITLTLTGAKDIIDQLEAGDLEIHIDANEMYNNEWVLHVNKKNLVSLNPAINLSNKITQIEHQDYIIYLSKILTDTIPVRIIPEGDAPEGYEFLGLWPKKVFQTVSGPEREVKDMKQEGVQVFVNLSDITKEELDRLETTMDNDEISYFVPPKLKTVTLPFRKNPISKEINDPSVDYLHLDFLREEILPLDREIPIRMFYPEKFADQINPKNYPIKENAFIHKKNNILYLAKPIYARNVSKRFLDMIQDHLEIAVIANPETEELSWSLQIIHPNSIENIYVDYWMSQLAQGKRLFPPSKDNEQALRERFRRFMQNLRLYDANDDKLSLQCLLDDSCVTIAAT